LATACTIESIKRHGFDWIVSCYFVVVAYLTEEAFVSHTKPITSKSGGIHANGLSLASDFKITKLEFGTVFFILNIPKINVMKTPPIGVQIFHEDGRPDKTKLRPGTHFPHVT
jgi:hypothetical protein